MSLPSSGGSGRSIGRRWSGTGIRSSSCSSNGSLGGEHRMQWM